MNLRYRIYRSWQKILHGFNFCHVRHTYPQTGDGHVEHRVSCSWCGISGTVMDEPTLRHVAAHMSQAAGGLKG